MPKNIKLKKQRVQQWGGGDLRERKHGTGRQQGPSILDQSYACRMRVDLLVKTKAQDKKILFPGLKLWWPGQSSRERVQYRVEHILNRVKPLGESGQQGLLATATE